jgi:hypothetical protein
MTLTKNNFCDESKKLISDGYILNPKSNNYNMFLDFLINELKELPFKDEVGETIYMRHDAKEVVTKLIDYLSIQSKRIQKNKEWDLSLDLISPIYNYQFYEVFKNIIPPNTNLKGICYSLDLVIDGKNNPLRFTLDRYSVQSKKDNVEVYRNGCMDLFYNGIIKVFTYQDKWS